MKLSTKGILLLAVFVFPICIFLFLKIFGRNEFDVPALYADGPPQVDGCAVTAVGPYVLPDSVRRLYGTDTDSLTVIFFGSLTGEELNQRDRLVEQTANDRVRVVGAGHQPNDVSHVGPDGDDGDTTGSEIADSETTGGKIVGSETAVMRRCVFFLNGEQNVVMVDGQGAIRGQYEGGDREDMDRLQTEIAIIFKRY